MNFFIKRQLLQFFFPSRCPVCGKVIGAMDRFCDECSDSLDRYSGSFSVKGASSFTAAFLYNDKVRPAIVLLKDGVCGNADYALGGELADKLKADGLADCIDIIVPAPLHRSSQRKRSFNQAELIAKTIGRELGKPVCSDAVIKQRKTPDQKELNRIMRSMNLKNAFVPLNTGPLRGKRVLLIDDVCTTGSTLAELTSLLLRAGASEVHCAACCKTPPHRSKKETELS